VSYVVSVLQLGVYLVCNIFKCRSW
jgi:hypothetical protein